MNNVFVQPLIASTQAVVKSLAGCRVEPGPATVGGVDSPQHDVCGMIGLSGGASGMILVHLNEQTALQLTGAMLGAPPTQITNDVVDVVGELTNMIAGGAKAQLAPMFTDLALPAVIIGRLARVGLMSGSRRVCVPFTTPWGEMAVEFSVDH